VQWATLHVSANGWLEVYDRASVKINSESLLGLYVPVGFPLK